MKNEDSYKTGRLTDQDVGSITKDEMKRIKKLKSNKTQRICLEGDEALITDFKVWCLLRKITMGEGLSFLFEYFKSQDKKN